MNKNFAVSIVILLISLNFSHIRAQDSVRTIHVFVALCDRENQGIISSNPSLENGEDAKNNQYWGALYGVKNFFKRSENWQLLSTVRNPKGEIIERCIFKHQTNNVYLVADAYRGKEIRKSISDFFRASSGNIQDRISIEVKSELVTLEIGGKSALIIYVGHNGLMDFELENYPMQRDDSIRRVIVLACASRQYFCAPLRDTGVEPLLLTTGLMAPEAYTLESAIEGWISNETDWNIRLRAARAYDKYQNCGFDAARNLFVTRCSN